MNKIQQTLLNQQPLLNHPPQSTQAPHLSCGRVATLSLIALLLVACGKNEDVSSTTAEPDSPVAMSDAADSAIVFSKAEIGHTLDEDKRVVDANTEFGAKDTVYVSVETRGAGKSTLTVKYKAVAASETDSIEETTQKIDSTGTAVTQFQIYHNGGWEPGIYLAEIFLDGKSVAVKEFTVK